MEDDAQLETTMNELEDLGNLFEFGDIDLNNIPVPDVDSGDYAAAISQAASRHGTHPTTPFHDLGDPSLLPVSAMADFAGHDQLDVMQGLDQQHRGQYLGSHANQPPGSGAYPRESMYQPSISEPHQPEQFHFNGQQRYIPSHHVPPTPNSYEMHGRSGAFMSQQQQQQPPQFYRSTLEQQRYQMQKNAQVAFTPMASPAGTPQFHMLPEFTTPGAYFSPLSSPMMRAQNGQHAQGSSQALFSYPNTAPSSAAPSPDNGTFDVEMDGNGTASQELPNRRKSRRKMATPKGVSATGTAKSSPAQKAQKRKPSTRASETDLRRSVTSQPSSASLRQVDSSEAESISPEPLSESVMGPPPRPGSTLAISTINSSEHTNAAAEAPGAAATPKSLLQRRSTQTLPNGQNSASQSVGELGGLDDLALPEAARPPAVAPINTQIAAAEDEFDTPRIAARKTPKLGSTSTPSSAKPLSALASPSMPQSPATVASTPAAILKDKKEAKGGRAGGKKRGSVSQSGSKNLPRISPSIKPLLPEGSPLHSSTQALLLASKSNYQNLLEGNHLPGVNYPDYLSTGLTSKRTSHKVAEQGRRNRINDALKEMQSLVPKPSPSTKAAMKESEASNEGSPDGGDDEKGDKEDGGAKSSNSKAATVELANEYIKRMQKDCATRDAEMDRLRTEIEELRQKLGEPVDGGGDSQMDGLSPENG